MTQKFVNARSRQLKEGRDGGRDDQQDRKKQQKDGQRERRRRGFVLGFGNLSAGERRNRRQDPLGDPSAVEDTAHNHQRNRDENPKKNDSTGIGSHELRGNCRRRMRRDKRVRDGERGSDWQAKQQQRTFRFARQTPGKRRQDDEAHFEKHGQTD